MASQKALFLSFIRNIPVHALTFTQGAILWGRKDICSIPQSLIVELPEIARLQLSANYYFITKLHLFVMVSWY